MELRELAEQILFATTLEGKLQSPDSITDEAPGPALSTPETPGRPAHLRFKPAGTAKGGFPGSHQLEDERERGRLLHFFANHELLATELMALVLLKFPDAPPAFRRGVWQTLRDEQEHTRLYLARMRDCGVEFGELPLSGFFWRAISAMESPMDYVAGLSLTFEQANLDFARQFAGGFARVGDDETAGLLEKIYHDEIAHVASGLKWFRRWKNPNQNDWEAFCHQLKFPLSPRRAKGSQFNIEGRQAAGLDAGFIAGLSVYSQSKGRTPNVFVFNPFAEGRIARGPAFNPVQHQAQLARDLANLPQFLGRQDDIVLVEKRPSVEFLNSIQQAGFALPEFVELARPFAPLPSPSERERNGERGIQSLRSRKIGRLRPWAWGPDSLELLEPLFAQVTGEQRTSDQRFSDHIAQFYSKAWSAAFLGKVLTDYSRDDAPSSSDTPPPVPTAPHSWLCSVHEVGVPVNSLEETLTAVAAIRSRGHHRVVVKEALGLAGRNAIRLWEPELLPAQRRWIESAVQQGGSLVVEPWLERVADFSVQFEMTPAGLKLFGYTGLINDLKGQFQANWAAPNFARRIPSAISSLFQSAPDIASRLGHLYSRIRELLEEELGQADYLGPIGIDAFVYRDAFGALRLKPIVEINPRYTMGRLTLELMKQTTPGAFGLFRLLSRAQARAEGCDDFTAYARDLNVRFPLRFTGAPTPRILEGALCLNDPAQAQVCLAVFRVGRGLRELIGPERG